MKIDTSTVGRVAAIEFKLNEDFDLTQLTRAINRSVGRSDVDAVAVIVGKESSAAPAPDVARLQVLQRRRVGFRLPLWFRKPVIFATSGRIEGFEAMYGLASYGMVLDEAGELSFPTTVRPDDPGGVAVALAIGTDSNLAARIVRRPTLGAAEAYELGIVEAVASDLDLRDVAIEVAARTDATRPSIIRRAPQFAEERSIEALPLWRRATIGAFREYASREPDIRGFSELHLLDPNWLTTWLGGPHGDDGKPPWKR